MYRAASPTHSEDGVDISRSLFQDGEEDVSDDSDALAPVVEPQNGVTEESEDEDEAMIAATQAAANRKRRGPHHDRRARRQLQLDRLRPHVSSRQ